MGNLVRSLGQRFGFGKKYDDTSTSISEDFNNNLSLGGINTTPTSTRFKDFAPRVGNTMPKATITGSSNITGGMAPNDYDIGNLGINNNDYGIGNPGQYATADMINEFGDGRMGNINDEFGYSPEFQAGLTNEFGESPEFNVSQINEFGQSPEFNAGLVNEFGQSPEFNAGLVNEFGQSPEFNAGLVNEFGQSPEFNAGLVNEFGDNRVSADANDGFQGIGETIASITNNELPGNNTFAFAPGSIKDNQIKQAYNAYNETGFGKSNLEKLMQEDLESGGQLSLPKTAYSMIG